MKNLLMKLAQTDELIKEIFHFTNVFQVKRRKGAVLLLEGMVNHSNDAVSLVDAENSLVVKMKTINEVKDYIINNDVRLFVFDIISAPCDVELMEWIKDNHPDLPVIVIAKTEEQKEMIENSFPDVEIITHDSHCKCLKVMDYIKVKMPNLVKSLVLQGA